MRAQMELVIRGFADHRETSQISLIQRLKNVYIRLCIYIFSSLLQLHDSIFISFRLIFFFLYIAEVINFYNFVYFFNNILQIYI